MRQIVFCGVTSVGGFQIAWPGQGACCSILRKQLRKQHLGTRSLPQRHLLSALSIVACFEQVYSLAQLGTQHAGYRWVPLVGVMSLLPLPLPCCACHALPCQPAHAC